MMIFHYVIEKYLMVVVKLNRKDIIRLILFIALRFVPLPFTLENLINTSLLYSEALDL